MELKTTIGNIVFPHRVMNAAGTCKTLNDVRKLAASNVAAVVVGSITMEPRDLPAGETFFMDPNGHYSLNSRNLYNGGLPYYRDQGILREMVRVCHEEGKTIIVSVAGFSPPENLELILFAISCRVDAVEINGGCPNILGKPIMSYDPEFLGENLEFVESGLLSAGCPIPIIVKLSPIPPILRPPVAQRVSQTSLVVAVVVSNTLPDGFAWHPDLPGKPFISPNAGYAGMAGAALKPLSLGLVGKLRPLLPERIRIIGAGGIESGRDVRDYLRQGAVTTQVATHYMAHGEDPRVFDDILMQYAALEETETPAAT